MDIGISGFRDFGILRFGNLGILDLGIFIYFLFRDYRGEIIQSLYLSAYTAHLNRKERLFTIDNSFLLKSDFTKRYLHRQFLGSAFFF